MCMLIARVQCFFFFAIVAIDPNASSNYGYDWSEGKVTGGCQVDHNVAFTLPVLSLVVITILNDGTIITIAYDKVIPDTKPQKWDMVEVALLALQRLCVKTCPPPATEPWKCAPASGECTVFRK
jgi:hypothetical protein